MNAFSTLHTLHMRSFTHPDDFDPAAWYQVELGDQINCEPATTSPSTCSCPAFQNDQWCKHLVALGQYRPKKVRLTEKPNFAQALSGLVKCIRIRNLPEAAYWLKYCWSFNDRLPGAQFRTVRRLLIGSAEDGHSIAVMEEVSKNFSQLLAKVVPFRDVLAQLIHICSIANWWHPDTGGPQYIYDGMLAARQLLYAGLEKRVFTLEQYCHHGVADSLGYCLENLKRSIAKDDRIGSLYWVQRAAPFKGWGLAIANTLLEIAINKGHEPAQQLMEHIYLPHSKALANDNNFLCQAAWLLSGGYSPVIDQIEPVTPAQVDDLLEQLESMPIHAIPEWCCDGVHCIGNDVRYLGTWDRMNAVCCQYAHYERVSPDDPWLERRFYEFDGLKYNNL